MIALIVLVYLMLALTTYLDLSERGISDDFAFAAALIWPITVHILFAWSLADSFRKVRKVLKELKDFPKAKIVRKRNNGQ